MNRIDRGIQSRLMRFVRYRILRPYLRPYLEENVETYLAKKAEAKGVELSDLVNDLLRREIEIIEAVR